MVNQNLQKIMKFINFVDLTAWDVKNFNSNSQKFNYKTVKLKEILSKASIEWVDIIDTNEYPILGVRAHGQGVYINRIAKGNELTMRRYQRSKANTLFFCKVRTVGGQWGIVYPEYADTYASSNMTYLDIDITKILPKYLEMLLKVRRLTYEWDQNAIGADGRHFTLGTMLDLQIPLPPFEKQKALVNQYQKMIDNANNYEQQAHDLEQSIENNLKLKLGINVKSNNYLNSNLLQFAKFSNIIEWSYNFLSNSDHIESQYNLVSLKSIISNFMINNNGDSLTIMTSKYPENKFTYIGMEDIEKNTGTVLNNNIVHGKEIKSATVRLPKNYFIYGKLRPYLNKYYFNDSNDSNIVVSSEFFVFNSTDNINYDYFKNILSSFIIQEQIKDAMKGARMPRITKDIFLNLLIPLPPPDIQNEIAKHITNIKDKIKKLKQQAEQNISNAIVNFEKAIFHHENH